MDQKLDTNAETLQAKDQLERNGSRHASPNVRRDQNGYKHKDGANHPDNAGRPQRGIAHVAERAEQANIDEPDRKCRDDSKCHPARKICGGNADHRHDDASQIGQKQMPSHVPAPTEMPQMKRAGPPTPDPTSRTDVSALFSANVASSAVARSPRV